MATHSHRGDETIGGAIEPCTEQAIAEWNRVRNTMQGIRGWTEDDFIGGAPAEKFFLNINNWHPLSGYKETLCGELDHFSIYDPGGDEMDWNNFVIPASDFEYVISEALPYKGSGGILCFDDSWHSCKAPNDCIEAEATPDQTFYENPWFPKSTGVSNLQGQQVCLYGPWVRECVHGQRPEIHPSELFWWRGTPGDDVYWMMTIQDDSQRFDDAGDFDRDGYSTPGWEPWAVAPRNAFFDIAFEVDPAGPTLQVNLEHAYAHNVVTSGSETLGATHTLKYAEKVVAKAVEKPSEDDKLVVNFRGVCKRPNGTLQGYVALQTSVGVDSHGKEGYQVVRASFSGGGGLAAAGPPPGLPVAFEGGDPARVVRASFSEADFPAAARPPPEAPVALESIEVRADGSSVRAAHIGGKLALVGDFSIENAGTVINKVEFVTAGRRTALTYESRPGGLGVVKGVPLLGAGQVVFDVASGNKTAYRWPGMTIVALFGEKVDSVSEQPSSWTAFAKAAAGRDLTGTSGLPMKRAGEVKLAVVPRYALLRNGRGALEEESPFVERLNSVLARNNAPEIAQLWGTSTPFQIQWSFNALNLATGSQTKVAQGARPVGQGQDMVFVVEGRRTFLQSGTAEVDLPVTTGEIYELEATAKLTDPFGSVAGARHKVWSHFLGDASPTTVSSRLLPDVAAAADIPLRDLSVGATTRRLSQTQRRNPKVRRALIVNNFARAAAEDGRVTFREFVSLTQGAKLLGRP